MPRRKDNKVSDLSAMMGDRVMVEPLGKKKFIITKMPSRRRKKTSKLQLSREEKFRRAIAHAKLILSDPKKKASINRNLKGHRNAFQRVLSELLKNPKAW